MIAATHPSEERRRMRRHGRLWKSRFCAVDLEELVAALGEVWFCPYFVAAPIQCVENITRKNNPPRAVALKPNFVETIRIPQDIGIRGLKRLPGHFW